MDLKIEKMCAITAFIKLYLIIWGQHTKFDTSLLDPAASQNLKDALQIQNA